MIMDHMALADTLRDYGSPRAKITRMIRSGEVIQLRRGLFLKGEEGDHSLKGIAAALYGPSYISFEYALALYGLIPERAAGVTSAVYGKNKDKAYHTPVGDFYYRLVPDAAYPYGITRQTEKSQSFLLASPEKALCDSLYKAGSVNGIPRLESLLFDEWRMERERVASLDGKAVVFLAPLYGRKSPALLAEWMKKEARRA